MATRPQWVEDNRGQKWDLQIDGSYKVREGSYKATLDALENIVGIALRGPEEFNHASLARYVADDTPIGLIAGAWLGIADFDLDETGKSGRSYDQIDFYVEDEWCKMALRVLRGFAEYNSRPQHYPWPDERFDRFWRRPMAEKKYEYLRDGRGDYWYLQKNGKYKMHNTEYTTTYEKVSDYYGIAVHGPEVR